MNYKTMTHKDQRLLHRFIQPTSRATYNTLLREGVIGQQEADYLDLLRCSPQGLTDSEAAKVLFLPCSTVSARRNGIMEKHKSFMDERGGHQLIVNTGTRKNNTGKSAIVWNLSYAARYQR